MKKLGRKKIPVAQHRRSLTVRLPPEVLQWLTKWARESGQSQARIIEEAVRQFAKL